MQEHCHLSPSCSACRETLAGKRIIRIFHLPCTVANASTAANVAAIAALVLRRGRIARCLGHRNVLRGRAGCPDERGRSDIQLDNEPNWRLRDQQRL